MHLRGALSSKQATDKHWALKKSAQEYLQASLSKALNVSKDQIQVIVKSSGTNHVRAVLRLESPPGRSAALQDALSKEVENGNVISLARQAVREDYLKKLAGMKLAALYMDAEFPASAASIWGGGSKMGDIDESIRDGVKWVRPANLVQSIQAKEQIAQGVLERMVSTGSFKRTPSRGPGHPSASSAAPGSIQRTPSRADVSSGFKRTPSSEKSGKMRPGVGTRALKFDDIGSKLTSGLKWQNIGASRPSEGRQLTSPKLAAALQTKLEFTQEEWDTFGIPHVHEDDFIRAGSSFFKPASSKGPEKPVPTFMLIGAGSNEVLEGKGVDGVGNSSFLAAVWMLSSRKDFPSFVRGLFVGKDFSSRLKYGVHSVNLFVRGKWRVYTIDDLLPVDKDFNLIFSCAVDVQVRTH